MTVFDPRKTGRPAGLMVHQESFVEHLKNSLRRDCTKHRPDRSDLAFVMLVLIVAIGMTLVSIASGIQIDPEIAMLVQP